MTRPDPNGLATVPLFAGLSSSQLSELATHFEVEQYPAGHSTVSTGSHGYAFFIIAEGSAHAELDGDVLERLQPGAVFGEMAFFAPNSRRSATVVADSPITVYSMFGTQFRAMQMALPEVAQRLEDLFHERQARVAAHGGDHG